MTAPRPLIVEAVEAFKCNPSSALLRQLLAMCDANEADLDHVWQEVGPALAFRWPKKRGPKPGGADRAFKLQAMAVKEVHNMVVASGGKLSKADAIREVAPRYRFPAKYLAHCVYGDHAAVRRLLPEIFCRAISP